MIDNDFHYTIQGDLTMTLSKHILLSTTLSILLVGCGSTSIADPPLPEPSISGASIETITQEDIRDPTSIPLDFDLATALTTDLSSQDIPENTEPVVLESTEKIPKQNPTQISTVEKSAHTDVEKKSQPPTSEQTVPMTTELSSTNNPEKNVAVVPSSTESSTIQETSTAEHAALKESQVHTSSSVWIDGHYLGEADGKEGMIKVQVTVKTQKIDQINVLSHGDSENLAQNVFRRLTKQIIATQNPDVDGISGATLTSQGFITAVKNALTKQ